MRRDPSIAPLEALPSCACQVRNCGSREEIATRLGFTLQLADPQQRENQIKICIAMLRGTCMFCAINALIGAK